MVQHAILAIFDGLMITKYTVQTHLFSVDMAQKVKHVYYFH